MTTAVRTQITADGERWLINGQTTYQGRQYRGWDVEGLLMNSRMTNAMFDDENPVTRQLWAYPDTGEWDADRNTDEFIAQLRRLPRWVSEHPGPLGHQHRSQAQLLRAVGPGY